MALVTAIAEKAMPESVTALSAESNESTIKGITGLI